MNVSDRLIVALDVSTAGAVNKIVAAVGGSATTYKVGMQLYTATGPPAVRDLVSSGRKVFLDLKYHDIPNTVANAVRQAAALGVDMLTVHTMGGGKMLRAAVESARASNRSLKVLAVTVLTSMDDDELNGVGVSGRVADEVVLLAKLALASGCHGVVASAQDASELRRQLGDKFLIVTPGVRPAGADHGDQARVVTPAQAIGAGASHIVVGRPIIEAANPAQAVKEILAQMSVGTVAIGV